MRLPVVGVMGSGTDAHAELAVPLGLFLARAGVHLLTGGGAGTMACVSRAFASVAPRAGLVVGVLPGHPPPRGYPNPSVEIAIATHLPGRGRGGDGPDSRNHVNVLSSDLVVALPGGPGTASEIKLARTYGRRVVLIGWSDAGRAIAREHASVDAVDSVEEAKPLIDGALATLRAASR